MKTLTIHLDNCLNGTFAVSGNVRAITSASIERLIVCNKKQINRWLLFGDASFGVTDDETGEVVADGTYMCNVFASESRYKFKLC